MAKPQTLEICRKYLFDNPKEKLSPQLSQRLTRIRSGFTHWNEFPMYGESHIRDFLIDEFDIAKTQAYDDINIIKMLLGNVVNASKQWHLHTFLEMAKETYEMSKDKKDTRAMAMVIGQYGRYTQLHIPDQERIPWGDLIPKIIEPTEDPTVIGLVRDPNAREKAAKLMEKYADDITSNIKAPNAEDVDFVEIKDDESKG